MTESKLKLVVDQDGVTITGEKFRLTAPAAQADDADEGYPSVGMMDPAAIDGIISELQHLNRRTYGQYCGLSNAAEMVGERWGMLIIRDLLVGAKRFNELSEGLPLLSPDILSARLKEMQHFDVVRAVPSTTEEGVVRYELTEYGQGLDGIIRALGRWGARTLAEPRAQEIITINGLVMALRACFRGAAVADVELSFEVTVAGFTLSAEIAGGQITVHKSAMPDAQLRIEPNGSFKSIMTGKATAEGLLADEEFVLHTGAGHLADFVRCFAVDF